jgi:peptide chain release factor 1
MDIHATHISRECGLVTDSGGNTTEQSGHLGTSLSETENVVDEEQHILAFLITEVLRDSQASKSDTGTGTRRLIHLTLEVDDTGLNHFVVQIVTLASTLTHTCKNNEVMMQQKISSFN